MELTGRDCPLRSGNGCGDNRSLGSYMNGKVAHFHFLLIQRIIQYITENHDADHEICSPMLPTLLCRDIVMAFQ